jgi:hypothetical protein
MHNYSHLHFAVTFDLFISSSMISWRDIYGLHENDISNGEKWNTHYTRQNCVCL